MASYDVCVVGGCGHVGLPFEWLLREKARKLRSMTLTR